MVALPKIKLLVALVLVAGIALLVVARFAAAPGHGAWAIPNVDILRKINLRWRRQGEEDIS